MTCPRCNGTRATTTKAKPDCKACHGTGRVYAGDRTCAGLPCPTCGGRGRVYAGDRTCAGLPCPNFGGTKVGPRIKLIPCQECTGEEGVSNDG